MGIRIFEVEIELITDLLGTVPKDRELYTNYVADKIDAADSSKRDEEVETVPENLEERGWTGFHQDNNGLFVYDYLVRGFIRNAANVLKEEVKIKNLRAKITDYMFVGPRRIYFGKMSPDSVLERPLRAMTIQGPRVTLVKSDTINSGTRMKFEVSFFETKEISSDLLMSLLQYGRFQGLGQFRNGGYGRFIVKSFKDITTKEAA